jgi:acetyltransferase-like isoleucine patch superfamily enzyme
MKESKLRYLLRIIRSGGKNAEKSRKTGDTRSKAKIVTDMALLYLKHGITVKKYLDKKIGAKQGEERASAIQELLEKKQWIVDYDDNWCFLAKYSGIEWQANQKKKDKRNKAYIDRYHMGKHCNIQYGVTFISAHFHIGKIKIGDYVLFARNVDIDITGSITIEDGVDISEGVKILTHNHEFNYGQENISKECIVTPLTICDHVWIGSRATIMPGVKEIGRGAIISADAFVNSKIPPYAVVMGNPAKVVGFHLTPGEVRVYEENNYPPEKRIDIEQFEKVYNKYFINRIKDIKKFVNI